MTKIRQQISAFNEQLELNFKTSSIESLLENRTTFVDGVLTELWELSSCLNTPLSLNAVGGYGRKTLHPYSDVDICILYDTSITKSEESCLQEFITKLWDLGLTVGHSVRSLDDNEKECKNDITTVTNLLDIRHICGDANHAKSLKKTLFSNRLWTSERFFCAKSEEQALRYKKQSNQAFKLEPNLKEGPGGMRDIQTVIWVLQKLIGGTEIELLRSSGYFSADEYAELIESQNFIWRMRWALHRVAARDENRMLLEYQAEIASLLGFGESGNLAIERMMRQLFRATKRVKEINQMLMLFVENELLAPSPVKIESINQNFELQNSLINVRSEDTFVHRKEILTMFRLIAHSEVEINGIAPQTIRLMRQARRRLLGELQDFEECRNEFMNILDGSNDLAKALALMHHHGILSAYLTQWREIVGQMQFDMFHAYTVDEHTFQTILNVIELTDETISKRFPTLQPRFVKLKQRTALLVAALFHDIAKGRGGDHSELGAVDAQQFCLFHDLKLSDTNLVTWLVENHLLMSITSQRQDIHDPKVIQNFAKRVGSQVKLDALYCLTVADINATHTNLWTGWKASLLEKLYLATKKALWQGLENTFTIRDKIKERKAESLTKLEKIGLYQKESIIQLWKQFPLSFYSNSETEEIVYFTQKALAAGDKKSFISILDKPVDGCSCIFAYLPDRAGVFSDLFSTLSALKVNVKDAQINKNKNGYILEIVKVLDYNGQPILSDFRRQDIEERLLNSVLNNQTEARLSIPKHIDTFENKIQVEFLNSTKKDRTLLSITALDNPNFMGRICHCFHRLNIKIHSAKISTVGEMVENVFLVSDNSNNQLINAEQSGLAAMLKDHITTEFTEH